MCSGAGRDHERFGAYGRGAPQQLGASGCLSVALRAQAHRRAAPPGSTRTIRRAGHRVGLPHGRDHRAHVAAGHLDPPAVDLSDHRDVDDSSSPSRRALPAPRSRQPGCPCPLESPIGGATRIGAADRRSDADHHRWLAEAGSRGALSVRQAGILGRGSRNRQSVAGRAIRRPRSQHPTGLGSARRCTVRLGPPGAAASELPRQRWRRAVVARMGAGTALLVCASAVIGDVAGWWPLSTVIAASWAVIALVIGLLIGSHRSRPCADRFLRLPGPPSKRCWDGYLGASGRLAGAELWSADAGACLVSAFG